MARSSVSLAVVALLVAACGGKIEQSSDNTQTSAAGPYGGSVSVPPNGSTPGKPSTSKAASSGAPGSSSSSGNGGTWVNGPLGFVVRDAFSFIAGPSSNRELHGIWLTSFANACDKKNATGGSKVLRIDFSEEAGNVPPDTYPLEGLQPPGNRTAYAQVWTVTAAGCSAEGDPGGSFESGSVTIEKSDATRLVGSFQGIMIDADANEVAIDGHFDAPRCPTGSDACTPP